MMKNFEGIYAIPLRQYIDFKRSLGYKFKSAEYTYHSFDQFTIQNGETELGITKSLADKWSLKRPNESDNTRYKRVMYLIHFADFLNDSGYNSFIPRLPRSYQSTFTPYIFSHNEISTIFSESDCFEMTNLMNSVVNAIPAIFRLMYGTGIRISEVVNLKIKDVNLYDQYLIIKESKNEKERMIPFSDSVAEVCKQYRSSLHIIQNPEDHFFVKRNGHSCNAKTIYEWFRKTLRAAGIPHGGRGQGPRLHDLRHTFCVHSLCAMAESGLDLYYSLPVLSEYLGHQSLDATDKYVRLTAEMYPELLNDMNKICSFAFPEVKYHETD